MSAHDWITMEEQLMKRTPEDRDLLAQKIYQPPARRQSRGFFARLAGLLRRRPRYEEEPVRPAFR
jgi:hypothetical protein